MPSSAGKGNGSVADRFTLESVLLLDLTQCILWGMQDVYVLQQMLLLINRTAAATQIYSFPGHLRYTSFLESDQAQA